jgi:hypothetical protein
LVPESVLAGLIPPEVVLVEETASCSSWVNAFWAPEMLPDCRDWARLPRSVRMGFVAALVDEPEGEPEPELAAAPEVLADADVDPSAPFATVERMLVSDENAD